MNAKKLSAASQELLKKKKKSEEVTVIARTKLKTLGEERIRRAVRILQEEQLATRRTQLLGSLHERYGGGEEFCKNYKDSRLHAQAKVIATAPKATSLWLADAIVIKGTRAEIEDLTDHEDIESIHANPVFHLPEILETPLEDTPEIVDGSAWGVAKIQAPEAWGGFGRGENVLVGHLDTGVDETHPALTGKVECFFDTDDLGCTATAPYDSHFHGTHTAGTICGRSFHGVNIGVAPDARLCSANVLPGGSGTFAQIINGMQCVIDQGVHVINMSLGALGYNPIWNLPILNATLSGVCIVASIGNSGHGTSGGPGNDPLAIGVGATGVGFPKVYHETIYDDVVAGFSSGETLVNVPWLNLFQLTYMKPEISAPGVQVLSAVPPNSRPDWPSVHSLAALNGTSMAAPHVTGTIAVLLSTEPALMGDPFTVKRILMGAGREDFSEAGRDQRFGFGRVDVLSASETAVSMIN